MTTSSELFDIKEKHLIGKLILSPVSRGRILAINIPDEPSVITITASDLREKDIRIADSVFPVLADDFITYLSQPVMAVFGPDIETVETFCSQVVLDINTEMDTSVFAIETINPFMWTSGDVKKHFAKETEIIESEFTVSSQSVSLPSNERVFANYVDDVCHVKLSTQWPMHVIEAISETMELPKSRVKLYTKSFRADFDQFMVKPAMCASIAAAAAIKSSGPVELVVSAISWQPETKFKRQTAVNAEGKPVAEKISVTCDFGAYPIFVQEAYYNILAGLIPPYDLSAAEITIQIEKSSNPPAAFFGDLGYSTAVAFTEHHFTKIAKSLNRSPYEWRAANLNKVSLISERVKRCLSFESLKETLEDCACESWFNRNYSVFSQSHFANKKVSAIAGYAKGIGIACAQGIFGFSEKYSYDGPHSLTLTLTEEDKLFISLGFYVPNDTVDMYKEMLSEHLGVEPDKIMFTDLNSEAVKDLGPNVLSRSITVVPRMLERACNMVNKRLSLGVKKPIVQQIVYKPSTDTAYYDANTFGSIAIATHIDPIKVVPVIDNVTARLKFGKVYSTTILARRIRQIICTTISQVCPCAESNFTIDLKVKSNPHLPAGSCSSMLRGITAAALTSSISQALGHELHSFPITDNDVVAIVQMKKPTEVPNEA